VPEANVGVVIMTNALSTLYYPLYYHTLDELLNVENKKNWNDELLKIILNSEKRKMEQIRNLEEKRVLNTNPSLPLEKYAGYYGGNVYDSVIVAVNNNQLELQFGRSPEFFTELKHWHYDTYQIEFKAFPSLPKGYITFETDRNGNVSGMEIFLDNPDFDFTELDLKKLH
jgi:hypothetical protein